MAIIKKKERKEKQDTGVDKKGRAAGNLKYYQWQREARQLVWRAVREACEQSNWELLQDPAMPLLRIHTKEPKGRTQTGIYILMLIAAFLQ